MVHTGNFTQGDAADTYTITVADSGTAPTSAAVTVTDTLPAGLSPTAADDATANGWTVSYSGQTVTATRSDALAAGASYPALAVTVSVAGNAPASVTNTAAVSGGGEVDTANDTASDPTNINPLTVHTTIAVTSSANPATVGQPVTFTAMVAAADGSTPQGEVDWYADGSATPFATGNLANGAAQAPCPTSLPAGQHTIIAKYLGSSTCSPSTNPSPYVETINTGIVSGRVYLNVGNSGVSGAQVTLTLAGAGTPGVTTTTAADGSYQFTNLAAGTYQIVVVPPASVAAGPTNQATVTIGGVGTATASFAELGIKPAYLPLPVASTFGNVPVPSGSPSGSTVQGTASGTSGSQNPSGQQSTASTGTAGGTAGPAQPAAPAAAPSAKPAAGRPVSMAASHSPPPAAKPNNGPRISVLDLVLSAWTVGCDNDRTAVW